MPIAIHLEANILFSLICVLLFFRQRQHKEFDFLGTAAFYALLWASVGVMVLDCISWLIMADIIPYTDSRLMWAQSAYYLVQAILPLFFMMYCLDATGRAVTRAWTILMYVPVVFTAVILMVNFGSGFAFYITDRYVVRGDGFWFAILAPMIYILNSLLLCIIFYVRSLKMGPVKKKLAFHMLVCVSISFAGALVCSVVNYVSPWYVFVTALMYLYMQLHGYQEHSLDEMAFKDSLTGVKNHAAYSRIKEKMESKLQQDGNHRFAIAVMDVNNLKQVNDAIGHKAGDALIISAAKLLCDVFAHSPVCRIGGDEFVAILENSDYENREALRVAFDQEMAVTTFSFGAIKQPVSVALGIAKYVPERHTSFEEVLREADEAMYANKEKIKSGMKN